MMILIYIQQMELEKLKKMYTSIIIYNLIPTKGGKFAFQIHKKLNQVIGLSYILFYTYIFFIQRIHFSFF